jgi:hypothetical protein
MKNSILCLVEWSTSPYSLPPTLFYFISAAAAVRGHFIILEILTYINESASILCNYINELASINSLHI